MCCNVNTHDAFPDLHPVLERHGSCPATKLLEAAERRRWPLEGSERPGGGGGLETPGRAESVERHRIPPDGRESCGEVVVIGTLLHTAGVPLFYEASFPLARALRARPERSLCAAWDRGRHEAGP